MTLWLVAGFLVAASQDASGRNQKLLADYLNASAKDEKPALDLLVKSFKGDLKQAVETIRTAPPLSSLKAGTHHDLKFKSGTLEWDYSLRLPKDYDGTRRFPVLVLPDHGSVGAKDGIEFWEQDEANIEKVILFRPVILKHQEDATRFPDQKPMPRDAAIASVMRDALVHVRLHYAVDDDRLYMTGLSQAGYYSWYYGVSFPDQFAAILPESAGGPVLPLFILPLAGNLKSVAVRVLHTKGDTITPYEHAEQMVEALKKAEGQVELVTYQPADYSVPNARLHPGPHDLRIKNVLSWALERKRELPASWSRTLRYPQQGAEGRFRVLWTPDGFKPKAVGCREVNGELSVSGAEAVYQASPEQVLEGRQFVVNKKKVKPKPDLELLFRSFKSSGDRGRLAAAEIPLK